MYAGNEQYVFVALNPNKVRFPLEIFDLIYLCYSKKYFAHLMTDTKTLLIGFEMPQKESLTTFFMYLYKTLLHTCDTFKCLTSAIFP